jgi:hypothetical protein
LSGNITYVFAFEKGRIYSNHRTPGTASLSWVELSRDPAGKIGYPRGEGSDLLQRRCQLYDLDKAAQGYADERSVATVA